MVRIARLGWHEAGPVDRDLPPDRGFDDAPADAPAKPERLGRARRKKPATDRQRGPNESRSPDKPGSK